MVNATQTYVSSSLAPIDSTYAIHVGGYEFSQTYYSCNCSMQNVYLYWNYFTIDPNIIQSLMYKDISKHI